MQDEHGELKDLYTAIKANHDLANLKPEKLKRNRPSQKFFAHRSIHRDGIYAERYTPFLIHNEIGKVHIGFNWRNSYELEDNEANREKLYFALQFNLQGKKLGLTKNNSFDELRNYLRNKFRLKGEYFFVPLNVQAIHDYYIKHFNTSKGYQKYDNNTKFLRSLSYRTEKKKISTLEEARKILNKEDNFQITINTHHITLPFKAEWKRLVDEWRNTELENDNDFLKSFFKVPSTKLPHQKARKEFALPVKSGEGKFLIKRNSWNGDSIFQIANDSDSRKLDTKAFLPCFIKTEKRIGRLLSESARSEKLFLLNNEEYKDQISNEIVEIDPCHWFPITVPSELCKLVQNIAYCIDNISRPKIRFTPKDNTTLESEQIDTILKNPLLKARYEQPLKTQLEVNEQGVPIEYEGANLNTRIKEILAPVLARHYQ